MFMVGLEIDIKELHRQGKVAVLVSHAGITAPMTLGALLALFIYRRLAGSSVNFEGFALFMGVAMSITAFPVLARILAERKLVLTRMGKMAIACAAVDDITGWCVLAYVVGYIRASHATLPLCATLAGLLIFVAVMVWGVRPLLRGMERVYLEQGALSDHWKSVLVVLVVISAFVTEVLGLHLLFGAFLAGVIMPKERGLTSYIIDKFESVTTLLLLPLFFAYTGLRTRIGLVRGPGMWSICVLIIVVAVAGKLGGTSIAARLLGVNWSDSLGIGSLMNTRGLMELVVLNIGIDIKIISPELFSMMVAMALVTTMMTAPLLDRLTPEGT
jgi:Kef-type K+ transport system membrane component KefB